LKYNLNLRNPLHYIILKVFSDLLLKPKLLKEFQVSKEGYFSDYKMHDILMIMIILIETYEYKILKRKLDVPPGAGQPRTGHISHRPFLLPLLPVLILFGVSHFIYIFAFGDVCPFIFIYHKVVPPLWVAIYTKRLKIKIVKYNIFYDYLIKRRFGCDKYFRPQQINEYFLLSRFFKLHFNHSIKCMLKLQVKVTPDFCS